MSKYGASSGPLVAFFFINFQKTIIKKILVYTGLAIFKTASGSKGRKIKKDVQKLFKENHLNYAM